jgi:hypothetical protein
MKKTQPPKITGYSKYFIVLNAWFLYRKAISYLHAHTRSEINIIYSIY